MIDLEDFKRRFKSQPRDSQRIVADFLIDLRNEWRLDADSKEEFDDADTIGIIAELVIELSKED